MKRPVTRRYTRGQVEARNRRRLEINSPSLPDRPVQDRCDVCDAPIPATKRPNVDYTLWGDGIQRVTMCLPCGDPEEHARLQAAERERAEESAQLELFQIAPPVAS